ncbi:PIN domain-containing protein [Marivirga harenae]|uniref:PIN domain-containing protein n=1 Tax=Marivirga harenae TaxID=2010992 RepID=UPI0026E055D2|nr:PIN domain-containing protein [Marivirga harenae]WKV11548.1 PIN domain-containing protein [Marivirga harenae]
MILVDTSVWIEYLKGNEHYRNILPKYLIEKHVIAISAVFGELLQGVKNSREHKIIMGFWESLLKINEEALFLEAGKLSHEYKLYNAVVGLIDTYLLAAALNNDLALWSLDSKLTEAIDIIENK